MSAMSAVWKGDDINRAWVQSEHRTLAHTGA
jgi:hypothetical protein